MMKPKINVPKIGQLAWVYHVKSGKERPILVVNKFTLGYDTKVSGVYCTRSKNNNIQLDGETFVDVRRIDEHDVTAIKALERMVPQSKFKEVCLRLRRQIKPTKYGK